MLKIFASGVLISNIILLSGRTSYLNKDYVYIQFFYT
jgi:hypothetical protein